MKYVPSFYSSRHEALRFISEQSILHSCLEAMAVEVKVDLSRGVSEFFRVPALNKGERHSMN